MDDRLIAFTNRYFQKEINLNISEGGLSDHRTRLESLKDDWGLDISFSARPECLMMTDYISSQPLSACSPSTISYPPSPTYWAPYAISDLTGDASEEDTHIKALYIRWFESSGVSSERLSRNCSPIRFRPTRELPLESAIVTSSTHNEGPGVGIPPHALSEPEDALSIKVVTKDLKAMGLAAGGKLVQDIYRDPFPVRNWNTEATRLVNIHILDPASCEKVTHIVPPPPPPIDAAEYAEAKLPFYVVEEQVDNRLEGGDFDNVISVSAMDKDQGVTREPEFDPSKPRMCGGCEMRLCDCIIRPCDHQFCNVCIRRLDTNSNNGPQERISSSSSSEQQIRRWRCPTCGSDVSHVAGFSAPMNLPGEEALRVKVPVHVLKVEDGRVKFKSIQTTRI
ncbi:hypothetical protein EPUS_00014 [Endocarpon pusillum Z07020]|uniref:RING-type domain-containing protein n=1 Tax=Endocarpon pusillum (strain Z07020 / HMAS-L-300199) TaxID=1263415 RepID=U1GCB7_ENDPU|nr:uncharacterized protein EPUS_00014 [Endocarpon pusillum Z07020]ERF75222.1 hypothetical protein EPUS_00014 [Endocarpon pusillum Z07020]